MDFAVGTEVAVSVRPEGLQFTPASPGPGAWRCTITETTYLGEIVQIVCTAGGVTLRMTVLNPAGLPPRAGDIRSVTINPDHVRILPREAT
jgi:ABC-type Fe3+/spermidine/putrescine transport system ATPase subunit